MLFGDHVGVGFLQVTLRGLLLKLVYSLHVTCGGTFMFYFRLFVLHFVFYSGTRL